MNDWATYHLEDFIPYSAEVYLRLIARVGEAYWPLHLLFLLLGLAGVYAVNRAHNRSGLLLLAPAWLFSGINYFGMYYSEINWVGSYIAWVCGLQFILLILIAWHPNASRNLTVSNIASRIGLILALAGLLAYPMLAPLNGFSWFQAETFGIHPAPTAITTLGVALMALSGRRFWLASLIPMTWLLFSGLYIWALNIPWTSGYFIALGWVVIAVLSSAVGPVFFRRR